MPVLTAWRARISASQATVERQRGEKLARAHTLASCLISIATDGDIEVGRPEVDSDLRSELRRTSQEIRQACVRLRERATELRIRSVELRLQSQPTPRGRSQEHG